MLLVLFFISIVVALCDEYLHSRSGELAMPARYSFYEANIVDGEIKDKVQIYPSIVEPESGYDRLLAEFIRSEPRYVGKNRELPISYEAHKSIVVDEFEYSSRQLSLGEHHPTHYINGELCGRFTIFSPKDSNVLVKPKALIVTETTEYGQIQVKVAYILPN
jgi:hypothetical protein